VFDLCILSEHVVEPSDAIESTDSAPDDMPELLLRLWVKAFFILGNRIAEVKEPRRELEDVVNDSRDVAESEHKMVSSNNEEDVGVESTDERGVPSKNERLLGTLWMAARF
jgi:hypothetical protein